MNLLDILTPLYVLIVLGYILKKYQFPNLEFWPGIEKLTYYILFPTLIFVALLKADINLNLFKNILIVITIPALLSGLLQWIGFLSPTLNKTTFSSMFQGAVRNNTMISLVIVAWLIPSNGVAIIALVLLIMIPFNNLSSIYVLLRYGNSDNKDIPKWWIGVVKNPFIIACVFGLLVNALEIKLPRSLTNTAEFLGRSALPFALLMVGAGLKFGSVFEKKLAISLSSFAKLIFTPLLSWGLCVFLEIDPNLTKVAIIFSAMPTAVSSYILAKQMGGDADGMAQIVTVQTILAAFTIPIFLLIAQQY